MRNKKVKRKAFVVKKNSNIDALIFSGFESYYKATGIKTVWCWYKDRHIDQWTRTESPEINPPLPGHMMLV